MTPAPLARLRAALQAAVDAPAGPYQYEPSQRFAEGMTAGLRLAVQILDARAGEELAAAEAGTEVQP